jgi:hypothetical protein
LLVVVAVAGDIVGARHRRKLDAAEVDGEVRVFGEEADVRGRADLTDVANDLAKITPISSRCVRRGLASSCQSCATKSTSVWSVDNEHNL